MSLLAGRVGRVVRPATVQQPARLHGAMLSRMSFASSWSDRSPPHIGRACEGRDLRSDWFVELSQAHRSAHVGGPSATQSVAQLAR